ncbi:hypothetical protein HMPREF0373_01598 [Eubacterium ramulus ATCC 29099]|uniref:Uncharacterized protein n=1 Tax=Eubacterium ramulus ATCC 29099 TaxID=1256908 RepID=U2R083_EUBRA|nr:hypothetical protein HMPREF0373_01598 [Eubacterium ramulus ATCC 29099]
MGQKRYTACVITHSKFLSFSLMIMRIFSVKRTFAIRFRYLLMNAVALRPVSGSF